MLLNLKHLLMILHPGSADALNLGLNDREAVFNGKPWLIPDQLVKCQYWLTDLGKSAPSSVFVRRRHSTASVLDPRTTIWSSLITRQDPPQSRQTAAGGHLQYKRIDES